MAATSPTWPVMPPMPEVMPADREIWLEVRRYHLSIGAMIARKLGLKPRMMCPHCGGTFRHEVGAREE